MPSSLRATGQMWSVGGERAPSLGTISLEALSEGRLLLKNSLVPYRAYARLNP